MGKIRFDGKFEKNIGKVPTCLFFLVFCGIFLSICIGTMMPINVYRSFFQRKNITGTVETIGGRWSSDRSYKISFKLKGEDGKTYYANCNDSRCTTVEQRQKITLSCYEEKHFQSADELECRWGIENPQ